MPAYELTPIELGAEVRGIDLKEDVSEDVIKEIKKDVSKHRILVFKDQGVVSGDRHVEISKWFGELESTFYKHPKSPHPDVFRVSNDRLEGCTNVGRTGWHIDGTFQPSPFGYALYHMVAVPKDGDTVFAPLTEIVESLDDVTRDRWERLWMLSDRRSQVIHPMIYSHDITDKRVMCLHLGMSEAYVWDYGTKDQRITNREETAQIKKEIHQVFVDFKVYSHKWQVGDFIISDNRAVAHEASPQSQTPRDIVGLRVLHRTTVHSDKPPTKNYTWKPRK